MKKYLLTAAIAAILASAFAATAFAQQDDKTPEQREKEFYEAIEKEVERLEDQLELADWQVFYVDSILTHDYKCLQDEYANLTASKVSNSDLYYDAQDKWMEKIYVAMHKVLNEEQWAKYEKIGAARDKKARDKRLEKKMKKAAKKQDR
ncbi:MAG: hypothetical protein IJU68_01630 [Bacteroidales bacterium]|nr:hypothetical protein [Bacteroidales bacterium]